MTLANNNLPPKTKYFRYALYVLFAFFFVFGFVHYFFSENSFGVQSTINVIFLPVIVFLFIYTERLPKRTLKYGYTFSVVYSLALVVGKAIYDSNHISTLFSSINATLYTFVTVIGFSSVFGSIVSLIFEFLVKVENSACVQKSSMWKIFKIRGIFPLIMLLCILLWIPCVLAYYPGILSYDTVSQINQAYHGLFGIMIYDAHHPPLHTFILQICLYFNYVYKIEASLIYAAIQILILSSAVAKLITFLIKKQVNNYLILFAILLTAANPVVAIMSIIPTKDVLFAAFLMFFSVDLCRLVSKDKSFSLSWKSGAVLFFEMIFCCLLRNNAVFVFILLGIILFFVFSKQRIKLLCLFSSVILCYVFIGSFVYRSLGVLEGNLGESLCVPMQQIGGVVANDGDSLTVEQKEKISVFWSYDGLKSSYNPRFADPIKTLTNDILKDNLADFISLWGELFVQHPIQYIDSFLSLNLPYWYPDADTIDEYSNREYIETRINHCNNQYTYERDSKLPILYEYYYEKIASFEAFSNKPVVQNIFSISTPIWVLIFCAFLLLFKKHRNKIVVLLPSILLWLTYMAGPVSNFRYIFPIIILYPLFIIIALQPNKFSQ